MDMVSTAPAAQERAVRFTGTWREYLPIAALEFLESHPGSKGRAANFARSYDPHAHYRPSLDLAASRELRNACNTPARAARKH